MKKTIPILVLGLLCLSAAISQASAGTANWQSINIVQQLNNALLGKALWYPKFAQPDACSVTSIVPTTVSGSCNNNNTPTNYADDYFLVNVAVAFAEAPTTGTFDLKKGTTVLASVPVASLGVSPYTFQNVHMPVAATGYTLTASFSALTCGANLNNYTPGASCCLISNIAIVANSTTACNNNGTTSATDDFYTVSVQVTYSQIPTTGSLSLAGSGTNAALFNSLNTPAPSVMASSLSGSTYVFTGVKFPAGVSPVACTAAFSEIPSCARTLNNTSSIPSCSEPQCTISGVQLLNTQPCNGNGTTSSTDDYYTLDVKVNFANAPTTGTLNLGGTGVSLNSPLPSVSASSLVGLTSYTFLGVKFPANGAVSTFTASFSASPNCTANVNNSTIVQPCSTVCNIGSISFADGQPCNSNGTMGGNNGDDYYTVDVIVNYTNPPTTGTLNLTGTNLSLNNPLPSVAVSSLMGSSYTFQNVRFPANGVGSTFVVGFSASPNCTRNVNNETAVAPCSTSQCAITNAAISNNTGCNNNGTVGNSADDYYEVNITLTYSLPPSTGNLTLNGPLNPNVVPVSALTGNTHTFTGVRFPANGAASQFTASFTALPCSLVVSNTSIVQPCSEPQCTLSNAEFLNIVGCNNNGTTDPADDYYTVNVKVNYTNPPTTGTLNLTSTAILNSPQPSVAVSSLSGTSYTFMGVKLRANGQGSTLNVAFSAVNCQLNITNNTTISSCSDPQCALTNVTINNASTCNGNGTPNITTDDFYTGDVVVTYANPPVVGTLGLSGATMSGLNNPLPSVPVSSLSGTTYTFTGVKFPANGTTNDVFTVGFSVGGCSVNVNNTSNVPSCSTGSANCVITSGTISNVSSCNNNGTSSNASDDYYTANVTVNYSSPPTTGNLILNGTASLTAPSVPVSSLSGGSYTFTGVRFPANGMASSFFAVFSASPSCALSISNNTIVQSCAVAQCSIIGAQSSNLITCNNNGTPNISTDDYYTVNITVTYTNPPATGSLTLVGTLNTPQPAVSVSSLSGNSYTFTGVRFLANGQPSNYSVQFTGVSNCGLNVTNNTIIQPCSVPVCNIASATLSNLSSCNNNGTIPTTTDDYYTANITVVFSSPPATGTLNLGGTGILNSPAPSVAVSALTGNSYTFTGVKFAANGMASTFNASFSASPNCALNVNNTTMIASCSAPQCSITGANLSNVVGCNNNGTTVSTDDYYTASVTVNFTNPPATGTLNLSGTGVLNNPQPSVPVSSLSGGSYTFTGVRFPANGQPSNFIGSFSASINCALSFTNNNIVQPCSGAATCSISNATLSNASTCNNNGTPTVTTDDYYTANVTVTFANKPATGTLNLSGSGIVSSPLPSVAVSSLTGTSYTFTGVRFRANGAASSFIASFSANTACTLTVNNNTIVQPCSTSSGGCSIGLVYLIGASLCNNNGTPTNPADDYYTATVRVNYTNPPTTGTLNLSGAGILNSPQPSVAVSSLTGTFYNFIGVRFPANGLSSTFVVGFSGATGCSKTVTNTTSVQPCSSGAATCNVSAITITNASTCNNNGTPTVTTDDYYTANVTVSFTNAPTTGTLNLAGTATSPAPSVAVSSLSGGSYTFTGVRFPANGTQSTITASFSATPNCSKTVTNPIIVQSCSTGGNCSIGTVFLLGVSLCNNNGTPTNPADDYYTATVRVNYTNPPTTGTLNLSGAGILNSPQPSVAVSSLTNTYYNFIGVRFPANGTSSTFTAGFSAATGCSKTVTNITQVGSCSQ